MKHNEISSTIIGAAIEVHRELGPGLLESVYEACLVHLLREQGLEVKTQQLVPIAFRGVDLGRILRLDVIVEDKVIVELKAVSIVHEVEASKLLSYLRLSNKKLGLLINFHEPLLKDGVQRIVNGLQDGE
jgi:GxxExxY protein